MRVVNEVVLNQVGTFQVQARAVDRAGNIGQDGFPLTVFQPVVDGTPPVVAITSPVDGAMLTAPCTCN